MSDLYSEFTQHLTPIPGEDNINERRVTIMGYSKKNAKTAEANADRNFITIDDIIIDRAVEIKEGTVMFDITVKNVKIYGMSMRHMTRKDGGEFDSIGFPARKADNGKYYDIAWFPASNELKEQIAEKVIDKLNS